MDTKIFLLISNLFCLHLFSQSKLVGTIDSNIGHEYISCYVKNSKLPIEISDMGTIEYISVQDTLQLVFTHDNLQIEENIILNKDSITYHNFQIYFDIEEELDAIVINSISKDKYQVPDTMIKEVFTPQYFTKAAHNNILESMQMINGVKPQINCGVCNTGDIHINGLEGPYTAVMIDGMPLVSGLATVYGLSGIPTSLIEKIEIIKGAASPQYGSEAMGGVINIITKNILYTPKYSFDISGSSWGEFSNDFGLSFSIGKKLHALSGISYFNYSQPKDTNKDNFTDLTLQDRISWFQKLYIHRESSKEFTIASRYFYEDRWGGQMDWNKKFRGSDEKYGESIYTNRWELLSSYQFPLNEKIFLQNSFTFHKQNSMYGDTPYLASQNIIFSQLYWNKSFSKNELTIGTSHKYQYYNDNSIATPSAEETNLYSIYAQDDWNFSPKWNAFIGMRLDYHTIHHWIPTPRLGLKYTHTNGDLYRINIGNGFRVVSIFTEEHAALSGARKVIIAEKLKPEKSINITGNYNKSWFDSKQNSYQVDISAWYTRFSNAILPDYETNPQQIIYSNLQGNSISQGISLSIDTQFYNQLQINIGVSWQDVYKKEDEIKTKQMFVENFSGNWLLSYPIKSWRVSIDYTGNLHGKMPLPLLNERDPRRAYSETFTLHTLQVTHSFKKYFQIYGGIKNITNFTINKNNPFVIARSHDPYNKKVETDTDGTPIVTAENPFGLVFDPTYIYGPLQGRRTFLGIRFLL